MNRILSLLTLFFFSVVVSAADIKLNTRNLPANVVTEAQQKTAKVMVLKGTIIPLFTEHIFFIKRKFDFYKTKNSHLLLLL